MLTSGHRGAVPSACCALLLASAAAHAQDTSGRFSLTPTEGGFVRLDKETGAMSFCSGKDNAWSCTPMPDGQKELESRIDQLERENKALREERSELGAVPGSPPPGPDSGSPAPPGDLQIPKEEDVDKLFDYVEGMMKKFKERIKRLEKEAQKETPL